MENNGARLEMDPETVRKLSAGKGELWHAAHSDGSDNRVNGELVAEVSTVSFSAAFLTAGFLWLRKKFRNRGKTRQDLAAEKEAVKIGKTCSALEAQMLDYIRSAQEGRIDGELLGDLIHTLEEAGGYYRAGKLTVPDGKELTEMRKSIGEFTAAMAPDASVQPDRETGSAGQDEFSLIRNLLIRQKELTGSREG